MRFKNLVCVFCIVGVPAVASAGLIEVALGAVAPAVNRPLPIPLGQNPFVELISQPRSPLRRKLLRERTQPVRLATRVKPPNPSAPEPYATVDGPGAGDESSGSMWTAPDWNLTPALAFATPPLPVNEAVPVSTPMSEIRTHGVGLNTWVG